MGKVKDIKNSIVTLLEGLQYGDETAYGQVVSDTRVTFETYPAARVIMNGQPNEVSTNKQNERTPEFLIISYFQYEQTPEGATVNEAEAAAFDLAYDFNDLVIDALDNLQHDVNACTAEHRSSYRHRDAKSASNVHRACLSAPR